MNIGILGSKGFLGSNLALFLKGKHNNFKLFLFSRENNDEDLDHLFKNCEIIFHLIGANRSKDEEEFYISNVLFNTKLKTLIKNSKNLKLLIHASTIHVDRNDIYGKSKSKAESILEEAFKDIPAKLINIRFPGIFGKNSKPFYNSVVATFCYQASRNIDLSISNPEHELELAYIDDVLEYMTSLAFDTSSQLSELQTYKATVGYIADTIISFKNHQIAMPNIGNSFVKKLFSTYLTFQEPSQWSKSLKANEDKRGKFLEIIKSQSGGQVSLVTANPGETRGIHFHHTKFERFIVVSGVAKFTQKSEFNDTYDEQILDSSDFKIIDSIPGYTHSIENIGEEEMIALIWTNEVFDPKKPDTFLINK